MPKQLKLEPSDSPSPSSPHPAHSTADIDELLTAQLIVAWAGERGEVPRLGWWRTDLVSEFGGEDLFQRLLPNTWKWAVLQSVREAARRQDAAIRAQSHKADLIVSLYSLDFETDERVEERLQEFKREGVNPEIALPGLQQVLCDKWEKQKFVNWTEMYESKYANAPVGRLIKGDLPSNLTDIIHRLIGAFSPVVAEYPLPHFRRTV